MYIVRKITNRNISYIIQPTVEQVKVMLSLLVSAHYVSMHNVTEDHIESMNYKLHCIENLDSTNGACTTFYYELGDTTYYVDEFTPSDTKVGISIGSQFIHTSEATGISKVLRALTRDIIPTYTYEFIQSGDFVALRMASKIIADIETFVESYHKFIELSPRIPQVNGEWLEFEHTLSMEIGDTYVEINKL